MIRRFQIEDIVSQDEHGVVFKAEDTETGRNVAVRRIFPFGSDGGGLKGEQVAAYGIGIKRFSAVKHAGLRTVVGGGCDPVDGMPFLATEWVEGPTLARAIAAGPIAAASVVALMDRALEVCEALSEALSEDSVWVETSPAAIIVSTEDAERGFTFWVAPLSWLNEAEGRRGLNPLVKLFKAVTERVSPRDSPQLVTELKRWGAWLEANAATATLKQARKSLLDAFAAPAPTPMPASVPMPVPAAVHAHAPAPVRTTPTQPAARPVTPTQPARAATPTPVAAQPSQYAGVVKPAGVGQPATATQKATAPAPPPPKKRSVLMPLLTVSLVTICLGAGGFQYWRYKKSKSPALTAGKEVDQEAATQDAIKRAISGEKPAVPATAAAPTAPVAPVPPKTAAVVPPKPAPAKPASPKPAPAKAATPPVKPGVVAKPAPATASLLIPAGHPILGTWKYTFEKVAYTRTFATDKGASFCQLTQNGKADWKATIIKVTPDEVVIKIPTGEELHHVLSKDKKTLNIEGKYMATR